MHMRVGLSTCTVFAFGDHLLAVKWQMEMMANRSILRLKSLASERRETPVVIRDRQSALLEVAGLVLVYMKREKAGSLKLETRSSEFEA